MAEKILNTRIINKHASLAAWNSSTLKLKEGEIALAYVEAQTTDAKGNIITVPTYVMKVGHKDADGNEQLFSALPFLSAPASDVHSWAKASTKPGYNASEITRGESTVGADLTAVENQITLINQAIGSNGSVADLIRAAIEALDVSDEAVEKQFVTAVAEADGKISVTRRALTAEDIPDLAISQISGLQAALNAKADGTQIDAIYGAIGTAEDTAEVATVYGAIAAAKKAGTDASAALETYKSSNDEALANVRATAEAARTESEVDGQIDSKLITFKNNEVTPVSNKANANESAISALAGDGRTTETVKGNADAIADLESRLGDVVNVMNFRGVSEKGENTVPGHDITDPKAGDVIIYGEAEYVYSEGTWIKFGDASDNATAISELQGKVTTLENDLKDGGATYSKIEAAKSQADKGVEDAAKAQAAAEGAQSTANQGVADAKKANDAITIINGADTVDGSIAKAAKDTLISAQSYADGKAKEAADKADAAQSAINTHAEKQDNPHKVTAEQVGLGKVENKTVDEIKETLGTNGTVADGSTGFVTGGAVHTAIEGAKSTISETTTDLGNRLTTAESDIESIETNFVKVKTTGEGNAATHQLVVGEAEDVIIFDCGGPTE